MRFVVTKKRIVPVMALVFMACSESPTPIDLAPGYAVVYGQVVSPGGQPVAGAQIRVDVLGVLPAGCDTLGYDHWATTTGAAGAYRQVVSVLHGLKGCAKVTVNPPLGSGLAARSVLGPVLQFKYNPNDTPEDSARIDVELSASQ